MKSYKIAILVIGLFMILGLTTNAQTQNSKTEIEQITATLMDYIEGTANGEPDRLRRAFHKDFNLYTVSDKDSLKIRSGEQYISNTSKVKNQTELGG